MTITDQPPISGPAPSPDDEAPDEAPVAPPVAGPGHRVRTLLVSGGLYLVLSVGVWWHVWSTHPTSVTTCGCGDSSLFTWFLEWPAYAISHGLNPLYSTAMFHPGGVNLLANTSELGIGVVLAPVTWLFGPVATLNVALTLAPALSALAMFVLLRRWVAWAPAAFAGGLLWGFSPFVLVSLSDAHLMNGMLVVPPLVVACLDELLVRQRRRPVRMGVLLGLLLVAQFFIGTELLVIMGITGAIGVTLVVLYAAVGHREALRSHAHHALVGLGTGAGVAAGLLAYPVWFALAGPAHLSGPIWGSLYLGVGGTALPQYVRATPASAGFTHLTHQVGGYQGPTLSGQYLGIALVAVLAIGALVWRRDRRIWLFGAVGLLTVALSLGTKTRVWVPWRVLVHLPLVQNIIPSRFVAMTYLAAAVLLGVIVDRTRTAVGVRTGGGAGTPRWMAAAAGTGVALVALVPIAGYLSPTLPMTVRPVVLPRWYSEVAPHLPPGRVVLAFPSPYTELQSSMTWQAVDRMHFSTVGGGGPGGLWYRAGPEKRGLEVVYAASLGSLPDTDTRPKDVEAVRRALEGWGVTTVVVPDQSGLPLYEQTRAPSSTVALVTAATGQAPVHQAGAWVWNDVDRAGPAVSLPAHGFDRCVYGPDGTLAPVAGVPACILGEGAAP